MRLLRIPIITLALLLTLAGVTRSQVIGCQDLVKSTVDTVRVVSTTGKPGDTVLIPISLRTDSIVTAFQFLVQFDTTWLKPIFIVDSTCTATDSAGNCTNVSIDSSFIDHVIQDRFVKTDTSGSFGEIIDTITLFTANLFQGKSDVVACNFLPSFTDIDSLPGGDGVIFSLKFKVNDTMPHNQLANFTFFESDIFVVNDSIFPPETTYFPGCNESQLTTVWFDGVQTQTFQVFPTSNYPPPMVFRADTGFVPTADPTINLSASTTSVSPGGQVTLTWTATNADSVIVDGNASQLPFRTNLLSSNLTINVPTVDGSYTYTATAQQNSGKTAISAVVITVGGGGGTGPSVSFNPPDLSYTIDQGQTVSFAVQATNTTGNQITLTANALPNNAAFAPSNPVIGTGSVSGTFSFTPDFNQEGTFVISFTAQDQDGTTNRSVSIVVNKLQVDRLFSTSAIGQKPVGGLRGATAIMFPINLVTSKQVFGVQFDMRFLPSMLTVDSFLTTGRIPDYVVYDNIGQSPGNIRVVTFGLANEPVGTDTTTAILWAAMSISDTARPWTSYPVYIENGKESINPDPNVGSLDLVTDSGVVEVDSLGDVNLDRSIDVADAVNIVASIIKTFTLSTRQFATADVIVNDSVNVFDLVAVVNMIYGIPLPVPAPPLPGDSAVIMLAYDDMLPGGSDIVTISSEGIPEELAGVQLEVSYDPGAVELGVPGLTIDDDRYAISYKDAPGGQMKIVLYHMAPFKKTELIQAGSADLLHIPITARKEVKAGDHSAIRISQALFSTTMAASVNVSGVDREVAANLPVRFTLEQNYPNPFNPETSIKFSLSASARVRLTIYNVLGQEVRTLLNQQVDGGEHTVLWNATNNTGQRVSTGVYLYRLTVGDQQETRKMLLLK